jgi:hypothetical protein
MNGHIYYRRHNMRIWILGATIWRWLHVLSIARMVGGILDDYRMLLVDLLIFRWLIFIYILCDP